MIDPIKITFLGDICLNDDYSLCAERDHNPFVQVASYLNNSDLLIGNLEAVVSGDKGENYLKQTRLQIDYLSLKLLKNIFLNVVTLANNHIFDQLLEGFQNTVSYLRQNQIDYLGAFEKGSENKAVCKKRVRGKRIVFLNYVHPDTNPSLPQKCPVHLNLYDRATIISEISRYRPETDLIILLLHWGVDNSRFPTPGQRKDANAFVEAGANIIIGHHSHVLQGYERIGEAWVFYGLGNFAFSRRYENGKYKDLDKRRQIESVILNLIIKTDIIEFDWIPVSLKGVDVIPIKSERLNRLSSLLPVVSNKFVWPFYKFYLNIIYKIFFFFFGNGRNPLHQLNSIDRGKIRRAGQILMPK